MRIWFVRTWKIAALAATVLPSCVTLFGQAGVEGALTHALSSAAGSTAGGTLGAATNQLAGRAGRRFSSAASIHPVPATKNVPRKATPARAVPAPHPFNGSLITSIQGGEATETSCASSGNITQNPAEAPEKPNVNRNGCSVATRKGTDDHPSVINLPATR